EFGFERCFCQKFKTSVFVSWIASGLPCPALVNSIAQVGIVQISIDSLEINPQEVLRESFLEHVQTQFAAIQFNQRVGDPRSRHPGGAKQFAGNLLVDIARVLHRIVQVDFTQTVESLTAAESAKIQCQPRLTVQAAKTAGRTLQVNTNLRIKLVFSVDGRPNITPALLAQGAHVLRPNFNANPPNRTVREQISAGGCLRRGGAILSPGNRQQQHKTTRMAHQRAAGAEMRQISG